MKRSIKISVEHFIVLISLVMLNSTINCRAQYFTKVTNVITTDNGNSRSVNWIDYDNDDDLDIYISNGVNPPINAFLYENIGSGNFVKNEEAEVCKNNTSADGSSWADYNNDGYLDLYLVAWYGQRSYLYNNSANGNFQQVTDGIPGQATGYSESCSWGDYDNDGFVDLYIANSGSNGSVVNYFYHNNCGESFTGIPDGTPATDKATSRTVNWIDYDNDGDLDLFVSNESNEPNNLYRNLLKETGVAQFEAVMNDPVVVSENSSISSSWGDYNNDGYLDLFVANWGQNNELFQNNRNGAFTKISEGVQSNDGGCSFGCNWVDFDNDGDLDLFVANGWCSDNQYDYLYRNQLMETGTSTFEKVTDTVVTANVGWSYGSSWGDYDSDGDLDLLVAKCSENGQNNHNSLFRNDNGNENRWITIKCIGNISNKSAIGSKILVKSIINSVPVWQTREISAQESYCSENLFSHFGLGEAAVIDSIIVKWPSGINQYLTNTNTNQFLTIEEDTLLFTGIRPTCETYTTIDAISADKGIGLFGFYPNPIHGDVYIKYHVATPGIVTINLIDINGTEVSNIINKYCLPGNYAELFNTSDLSKGLYFMRLTSAGYIQSKKMVLSE